jgi:hypothetical protein
MLNSIDQDHFDSISQHPLQNQDTQIQVLCFSLISSSSEEQFKSRLLAQSNTSADNITSDGDSSRATYTCKYFKSNRDARANDSSNECNSNGTPEPTVVPTTSDPTTPDPTTPNPTKTPEPTAWIQQSLRIQQQRRQCLRQSVMGRP